LIVGWLRCALSGLINSRRRTLFRVLARKSAHADYASLRAPEVVRPSTMWAVSRVGTPKDVAYCA